MDWNSYFTYDPETGRLFWALDIGRAKKGQEAGTITKWGYRDVKLNHKKYKAHRIIWDMKNPCDKLLGREQIDHINHDKLDNRLVNLRKVSALTNQRNMPLGRANTTGAIGVYRAGKGWRAMIMVKRVQIYLGCFNTFTEALSARKDAEIKYGFHENHGKAK